MRRSRGREGREMYGKERKRNERIHTPLSAGSQAIAFSVSFFPSALLAPSVGSKHPIYNDDARILNQGRSFLRLQTPTGSSYWIPTPSA